MLKLIAKKLYRKIMDIKIFRLLRKSLYSLKMNSPEIIKGCPIGKKILVLAPHSDDEILGCGGTIRKYFMNGCKVRTLFLCNGSFEGDPKDIVETRREEALKASKEIGVEKCYFWNNYDFQLNSSNSNFLKLKGIYDEYQPDTFFVPFILDNHPDHFATHNLAVNFIKKYDINAFIFCYEVWSAMIPNRLVDITKEMDKKISALKMYESQFKDNNLIEKIKGLNRYRSVYCDKEVKYAEGFHLMSKKEFLKIDQLIS